MSVLSPSRTEIRESDVPLDPKTLFKRSNALPKLPSFEPTQEEPEDEDGEVIEIVNSTGTIVYVFNFFSQFYRNFAQKPIRSYC